LNWNTIESRWSEYTANASERWDRLTREQIESTRGDRDRLSTQVQMAYLLSKAAADNQISEWQSRQMEDQIRP
jgi:uncharacterized protein YjbJ (UPF0337 family)